MAMVTAIIHTSAGRFQVHCDHGGIVELYRDMLAFDFYQRCMAAGLSREERGALLDVLTAEDPEPEAHRNHFNYTHQP